MKPNIKKISFIIRIVAVSIWFLQPKVGKWSNLNHAPNSSLFFTYDGTFQARPRDFQRSASLDVRQLLRRSTAWGVRSGDSTDRAMLGPWLPSTTSFSGMNRKWTSSGALGSWIWFFSFAWKCRSEQGEEFPQQLFLRKCYIKLQHPSEFLTHIELKLYSFSSLHFFFKFQGTPPPVSADF